MSWLNLGVGADEGLSNVHDQAMGETNTQGQILVTFT
jgi:hypothetical protein